METIYKEIKNSEAITQNNINNIALEVIRLQLSPSDDEQTQSGQDHIGS